MRLKNLLVFFFLILTLVPTIIISVLLYKSGFELSKELYTKNLIESINVQADNISQALKDKMIFDNRFVKKNSEIFSQATENDFDNSSLIRAFESYLEVSEDMISICLLFDENDEVVYSLGEKSAIGLAVDQLAKKEKIGTQEIIELELADGEFSLSVVTPFASKDGEYAGRLVSIYSKSHIFKLISSYYKIADSSIYILRNGGEIVRFSGVFDDELNDSVALALKDKELLSDGLVSCKDQTVEMSGYYKSISNSGWYLAGFFDDYLIYGFINQYLLVYILIIIGVLAADIVLSLYLSRKVVVPVNNLIKVIEGYRDNIYNKNLAQGAEIKGGYFEISYLRTQFFELMKKILLVQHNFEGVYQLYQSSDMGDINIDIDVKRQTALSNKREFQTLMEDVEVAPTACVVEKFVNCFSDEYRDLLMDILEKMRDEHLSVTVEEEVYTPHLGQKWFHCLVVPMYENDKLSRLFVQLRDISVFKKQESVSFEQARKDALTGLLNRSGFSEKVSGVLKDSITDDVHAVLFIDLDYFKLVNDNFGHKEGDNVLCEIANILQEVVGEDGYTSRFGGDEFAVFLKNITSKRVEMIKEILTKRLVFHYDAEKISFDVTASIGVALWEYPSSDTLENLLLHSDAEMYCAKKEYKMSKSKNNSKSDNKK